MALLITLVVVTGFWVGFKIVDIATKSANAVFASNMALVGYSNYMMFPRIFGKGLNSSGDRVVITGKTFELGRGKNYSINEIADTFGDYPREYVDERPGEMRNTLNTDTMAKDMLGWNPKGDVIDYIKNNILGK